MPGGSNVPNINVHNPSVVNTDTQVGSSPNSKKTSRKRKYPEEITAILHAYMEHHPTYLYPEPADIASLSQRTGLTKKKVRQWYSNWRKRNDPKSGQFSLNHSPYQLNSSMNNVQHDPTLSQGLDSSKNNSVPSLVPGSPANTIVLGAEESNSIRYSPPMQLFLGAEPRDEVVPLAALQEKTQPPSFIMRQGQDGPSKSTFPNLQTISKSHSLNEKSSSAFSNSFAKGSSTRKSGKRRHSNTYPAERQGDKVFQCTVCCQGFKDKRPWERHEKLKHFPQEHWVCMLRGRTVFNTQNRSSCAFCPELEPSLEHSMNVHNISPCVKEKPLFDRSDYLQRHMNDMHNATKEARTEVLDYWAESLPSPGLYWCGFCGKWLRSWPERVRHIGNHFEKDNYDMKWWRALPERPASRMQDELSNEARLEAKSPLSHVGSYIANRTAELGDEPVDHEIAPAESSLEDIFSRGDLVPSTEDYDLNQSKNMHNIAEFDDWFEI